MNEDECTADRPTRRPLSRSVAVAASAVLTVAAWAVPVRSAEAAGPDNPVRLTTSNALFDMVVRGRYQTGRYDSGSARAVAYHPGSHRLFVVEEARVAVVGARGADAPSWQFDLKTDGVTAADGSAVPEDARANAVAVRRDGLAVVAVEASGGAGWLAFFDAWSGTSLGAVKVGAAPVAVDLDDFGLHAVVASTGDSVTAGSVAVVDLPRHLAAPDQQAVHMIHVQRPTAVTAANGAAWATQGASLAGLDLADARLAGVLRPDADAGGDLDGVAHYTTHGTTYLVTTTPGASPSAPGSFSIRTTAGEPVYDSGTTLDQLAAVARQAAANRDAPDRERADDAGLPLAVGRIGSGDYAFIGLKEVGGVAVFDVTEPSHPAFVSYLNNRDFSVDPERDLAAAGDLGPASLAFIRATDSPTGNPLLAVANEVSGTTTLIELVPRTTGSQAYFA